MKKLHYVMYLVVLFMLQACDEKVEPVPKPEAFLTITLDADYLLSEDMWVFATDESGKVLDAGAVKPGSSVILRTVSPPELINLTTFVKGGGPKVNYMFYTYAGIKSGDEIKLERPQPSSFLPSVSGKATINIQNCNPYTSLVLSDGHAHSQFVTHNSTSINAPFDLRQESSNILISTHIAMDKPVYGWVDNVRDAGVYTIDFNNLTPFTKTISVMFSESMSALITGRRADNSNLGYVMTNSGFSTISPDPLLAKYGYLDGFDEYSVFASSTKTMSDHYRTTHYAKYGTTALPEKITFQANSLTVENPSIGNFSFNYSTTYTYRHHYWREDASSHIVHWRVYTDKPTTPPITELPEAFTAKYPLLQLGKLTYFESNFIQHQDGYTYAQFLLDTFAGVIPEDRELFQDSFQQK